MKFNYLKKDKNIRSVSENNSQHNDSENNLPFINYHNQKTLI